MTWGPIETERLLLREWRDTDLDGVAAMQADPEWAQFMGMPMGTPLNRAESWRTMAVFTGHLALRGYTNWVLEEKETGEFVGRVGPWFPEGWPDLEIGWAVVRTRWGLGYAIEAARAAANWVHAELGTSSVIHLIYPENTRSVRVAEKLGATPGERFAMPFPGGVEVVVWRTMLPLLV